MSASLLDQFGDQLREARKAAGWTQDDLAKRMGIGRARVAQLENNYFNPSPATVEKVMEIFKNVKFEDNENVARLLEIACARLKREMKGVSEKSIRDMGASLDCLTADLLEMIKSFERMVERHKKTFECDDDEPDTC